MKIGILTFHRACNYGAVLQCYALQKTIENMDKDVSVIDYIQPYIEKNSLPISYERVFELMFNFRLLYRYLKGYLYRRKVYNHFEKFRNNFLHTTTCCVQKNIPQGFNLYLIGSDQLWSTNCTNSPDEVFWGNFKHNQSSKIVSYAVSGNVHTLQTIDCNLLKKYLQNFDSLSLREEKLKEIIEQHTPKSCVVSIDPTLLTTSKIWDDMAILKEECVVLYEARYLPNQENTLREKAMKIAKMLNCKLINLSTYNYSPEEFISYFKSAKYIITSSFHGVAFSLVFQKPFTAVRLNDGHDDRYIDLLNKVGATDCLKDIDFEPQILSPNYSTINVRLQKMQSMSLDYLKQIMR